MAKISAYGERPVARYEREAPSGKDVLVLTVKKDGKTPGRLLSKSAVATTYTVSRTYGKGETLEVARESLRWFAASHDYVEG